MKQKGSFLESAQDFRKHCRLEIVKIEILKIWTKKW